MVIDVNSLLIALVTGIPIMVAAYWGYKKSRKVDQISAQSGAATETRAGTAQVFDGLNKLNEQLQQLLDHSQDENREFRAEFRSDIKRLIEDNRVLATRLETCFGEKEELRRELTGFRRKYGNGDTPAAGIPKT